MTVVFRIFWVLSDVERLCAAKVCSSVFMIVVGYGVNRGRHCTNTWRPQPLDNARKVKPLVALPSQPATMAPLMPLDSWSQPVLRIAVLLLGLFAAAVSAQQPVDIYRVEAPVANQSEAERTTAAKATLGDVIVKVLGGDAGALSHPLVRQAIVDAPNYIAKFSYASDKTLVLNYSPLAINRLLQQAQLVAPASSAAQQIQVTHVQDFASFKQVLAYFKTVAVIRRVELVSVNKDVLLFNLTLEGDAELLKTSLAAGDKLQLDGSVTSPLSFRWQ